MVGDGERIRKGNFCAKEFTLNHLFLNTGVLVTDLERRVTRSLSLSVWDLSIFIGDNR